VSPQEALLRQQIARAAPPGTEYAAICISTQGFRPQSDPPSELVARLQDIRPPVKPWSACKWVDPQPVDLVTGRPAVLIANDIRCTDADRCSGTGGASFSNEGGSHYNYGLERRDGRWTITALITAVS